MKKCNTSSFTAQLCPMTADNKSPSVTYCPSDMTVHATGRTADVRWRQPRFREPHDYRITVSSPYSANRATLTWGSHRITYTARSTINGREVTCRFTVTVKREYTRDAERRTWTNLIPTLWRICEMNVQIYQKIWWIKTIFINNSL